MNKNIRLHPQTVQDAERLGAEAKRARRKKPVRRTPRTVTGQEEYARTAVIQESIFMGPVSLRTPNYTATASYPSSH